MKNNFLVLLITLVIFTSVLCSCEFFHKHTESDWIIDVESNYTSEGKKHTECTVCGDVIKSETIEKISEDIRFELNPDGKSYCVSSKNTLSEKNIVIPETFEGLPVTRIREYAFFNKDSIVSVIIPDTVTIIDNSAFDNCDNLENISMSDSVKIIGDYAFAGCPLLKSIAIGDLVESIGESAFSRCASLVSIDVDENNKHYKSIDGNIYSKDGKTFVRYAMGKKDSEFIVPEFVTGIADSAFAGCEFLKSITLPNSLESIGHRAFGNCVSLTSITIPDSVTNIGVWAFYNCSSLTNVVIPDSVTIISNYMFVLCTSLTTIVISDSIVRIGEGAFYGCSSLTIYCEAEFEPDEWSPLWNSDDNPVVWGYTDN